MHRAIMFFAFAIMAISALAAPTPTRKLAKRTFTVPISPRVGVARSPANEMARTYGKYGWEIIIINPQDPSGSVFGGESSSAAVPAPAATSTPSNSTSTTTSSSEGSDVAASTTAASAAATTTASSSSGSETGEVSADPESDQSEYLESVSIGGQTLNLDFDTGSADL